MPPCNAADRPGEGDRPVELTSVETDGLGGHVRQRPADGGTTFTLEQTGRTTGVLRLEQGFVVHLRVLRDEHAPERVLRLLDRAHDGHTNLPLELARSDVQARSPEVVDLADHDDQLTQRCLTHPGVASLLEAGPQALEGTSPPEYTRQAPDVARVDREFPGLYERHETPATDVRPFCPPQEWVAECNPGDGHDVGRLTNCGDCARVAEARWRGTRVPAGSCTDLAGEPDGVMHTWYDTTSSFTGVEQITRQLSVLGPGASAIVGVQWRGESRGHWFNVVNDRGNLLSVDAQSAQVGTWPPERQHMGYGIEDFGDVQAIIITPEGHPSRDLPEALHDRP